MSATNSPGPGGDKEKRETAQTLPVRQIPPDRGPNDTHISMPLPVPQPQPKPGHGDTTARISPPSVAAVPSPAAAPASPAAAPPPPAQPPSEQDVGIANKLQEAMKARTVEKGSEVSVIKLADIIKIVRDMLGGLSGKSEAALQDEIVRLKLQVNNLTSQATQQIAAERARADAEKARADSLAADLARMRMDVDRLTLENTALRTEVERLRAELAAVQPQLARAGELEGRNRELETLLGVTGKPAEELRRERDELEKLIAELEERARSLRSDVRYAQLIEEPAFAEVAVGCTAVDRDAAKAGARGGEQARAAAASIGAAVKTDQPAFKKLMDDVFARRGTLAVIARLETLSGVHNALRNDLERWQKATGE